MNWKRKNVKAGGKLLKPNFAKFANTVLRVDLGRGQWRATGMILVNRGSGTPHPPIPEITACAHRDLLTETWAEVRGLELPTLYYI